MASFLYGGGEVTEAYNRKWNQHVFPMGFPLSLGFYAICLVECGHYVIKAKTGSYLVETDNSLEAAGKKGPTRRGKLGGGEL